MILKVELSLWSIAVLVATAAVNQVQRTSDALPVITGAPRRISKFVQQASDDSLASLSDALVSGDVFRLARHASRNPFGAHPSSPPIGAPPTTPQPIQRVSLILKAIVGGPPWQGVVDGLPGHDAGTVVRAGDVFDRYTVKSVSRDTVIVQTPDTTYRLTMRSEW